MIFIRFRQLFVILLDIADGSIAELVTTVIFKIVDKK